MKSSNRLKSNPLRECAEEELFRLFHEYETRFPGEDMPNFWECGDWGKVVVELKKSLKTGKPWISTTPKDVIL